MYDKETALVMSEIAALSRHSRAAGTKFGALMTKFVLDKFEESGSFDVATMAFKFSQYSPDIFSLAIDGRAIECRPALCSANTSVHGLTGKLCSYGRRNNVGGKIVLMPIQDRHESLVVEDLAERGAVGAIIYQENTPLLAARVRYKKSSMPCVSVSGIVGSRLQSKLHEGIIEAHIVVRSQQVEGVGTNLVATPKHVISQLVFNAHRDSRIFSCGAIDNASGTSLLLYLSRRKHPRFSLVSTDAEEYGLLGAKELVRPGKVFDFASEKEVINLDSIGAGTLHLVTRSRGGSLSRRMNHEISRIAIEKLNLRLGKLQIPRGSDSDVFNEAGFEACWLRSYPTTFATTVKDNVENISPAVVNLTCRLLTAVVEAKRL